MKVLVVIEQFCKTHTQSRAEMTWEQMGHKSEMSRHSLRENDFQIIGALYTRDLI